MWAVGDLNGDGVTDVLTSGDGTNFKAHYQAGGFISTSPDFKFSGYSYTAGTTVQITDVNGDGRGDVVLSYWKKNSTSSFIRIYLNKGYTSFTYLAGSGSHTVNGSAAAYVEDMDRDGIAEIIEREHHEKNVYGDKRYYVSEEQPDVIINVQDPSGSDQTVSYTLYKGETDNWFPYPRRVVSSIITSDGRGGHSEVSYAYLGGKWDYDHRQFLGFEKIVTTLPKLAGESASPTIETNYRQDLSSVAKVAQRIWKDGAGTVLRKQVEDYTVQNTTEPLTSLNTASLTYSYDEGVERLRKVKREYDAYGQLRRTIDYGDLNKSGDERTYTRWSYPNKSKYIVNRWAVESLNIGTSYHYTDRRVWRRWHYYDGQAITAPPTKGLKTTLSQWDGGAREDKLALSRNSYDSHGNLVEQKNALGET